ncbi:hypothetical protein PGTUg99_016639 [Puccinia graminis f. sp. tritici]|uniref:Uncharacterized protein n=1 Tax=Puccinia graminis f. sp. tritici TaxID=56615 RepID=A0A5B0S0Y8_PUCGR|nr:hypothetical protein PGTUg99_016639 [Puccinia graminis f. sp. tritici]
MVFMSLGDRDVSVKPKRENCPPDQSLNDITQCPMNTLVTCCASDSRHTGG